MQFSVWTAESILKSSCVEVTTSKCMQHDVPIKGGLRDPRFGVLGPGKCATCGKTKTHCAGHFGHAVLAEPMYHISWMQPTLLHLRHLCEACGAYRSRCCGHKNGKYQWDKFKGCVTRNGEPYTAREALERFRAYGCGHLILTVLPIPPIHVRPPLTSGGKTLGENDLTYRLQNIMRKNEALAKCLASQKPDVVVAQAREGLQNALVGYINHNKLNCRRNRNKREYTSLTARLSSKEGRVRANLMGKRANSTARCVITPDDRLGLGEIGVPASVAKILTKNVKVTAYNKRTLEEWVSNGSVRYIRRGDGSRIDTSIRKPSLEVGWCVERSMKDGDVVLFNRQPSLHKMSMMAHTVRCVVSCLALTLLTFPQVKILPYDTFRMNVSCTTPYNGDFDGVTRRRQQGA
jgi:DNA-directed RNA polymerase beta' subunit